MTVTFRFTTLKTVTFKGKLLWLLFGQLLAKLCHFLCHHLVTLLRQSLKNLALHIWTLEIIFSAKMIERLLEREKRSSQRSFPILLTLFDCILRRLCPEIGIKGALIFQKLPKKQRKQFLLKVLFFKIAQKVSRYLNYFCKKI